MPWVFGSAVWHWHQFLCGWMWICAYLWFIRASSNTYTLTHSGVKWEFTARKYVIIANDGDQSSTKWKLQTGMNQGQCFWIKCLSFSHAFNFFWQRSHSLRILECHLSFFLPLSPCHYLPRVGLSILGQATASLSHSRAAVGRLSVQIVYQ